MRKPLTDKDGEVRELTLAEIKRLRPISEVDSGMAEAVERLREQYISSRTTPAVKTVPPENRQTKPPTVKAKIVKVATLQDANAETADAKPAKIKAKAAKANVAKARRAKGSAGPARARA